ncbi:hypothetical protein [Qipengyuania nanhaisediminis]|uniref:hypothetical protein n=1 Tax=Qipengyuania nanhaisediminis TaxID=604088 RepID=UPI0038B3D0F5
MIAGINWRLALLAIAIVTAGVQLDRQSGKTLGLASEVPEPVRSVAQRPIAALALDSDDPDRMLVEARRLVERRPIPAEHLRILAQAQFAAGDAQSSALTIQYAAQRGWREPLAQETLLRLALDAGDAAEAAKRYAALFLRRNTEDALLEELGTAVLAEPGGEGRRTLTGIVSGGTRWHNQFLQRGARVMPADAFIEIVRETSENGTRFDCEALSLASKTLARRDDSASAEFEKMVARNCQ